MENIEINNLNIENELATAQEEIQALKEANQLKDEFVSMATHQIRGPLGAIRGYISLLLEGDYGEVPESIVEPLKIISESVKHLGMTVNDFLDASRIDQGAMRYYRKDFDFIKLIDEAVSEMKVNIEDKGLELKLNIPTDIFLVHGDKAKLKHVLVNLIDNAVKYTEQGSISISAEKVGAEKIVLKIKDSGVGIKPETMPLLFKKFSRCVDASQTNISGTGLGLYIAKQMIEAQNGRVWAESAGAMQGSEFYIELPLAKTEDK
jgi:signal transduction histidine kinase